MARYLGGLKLSLTWRRPSLEQVKHHLHQTGDGQYHGGVGHTLSTILDYPFLTGRSTQDSKLVGELMIEALEHGLKRYGW